MNRLDFHSPVDQVAGHDIHNHYFGETEPPDDPDASTQCPQCRKLTWRYSQHCIHCKLDLVAWRKELSKPVVKRRLRKFAAGMGTASGITLALAALLHHPYTPLVFVLGTLLGAIAFKTAVETL